MRFNINGTAVEAEADIRDGYITAEAAARDYGVG